MKDFKKQCGTCEHWMKKSQCPRESGPGKGPSMSSPPCSHFLLEWSQASKMTAPSPPPVRTGHSPIVKWGEIKESPMDGHTFRELEGVCPDGQKVSIYSQWTGRSYDGVIISASKFTNGYKPSANDFPEAMAAIESYARTWYQAKMEESRAKLANYMYCLGLDFPLSVHQKR